MGLGIHGGTMPGAVTPVCNDCGTFLCWDLSIEEAGENLEFWESGMCLYCNDCERLSLTAWRKQRDGTLQNGRITQEGLI